MVKVQKPAPKSFKDAPNKPNKVKGVKKEKAVKEEKALPATNVEAKKAKKKLVEKAVQEQKLQEQVKPVKNVEKANKAGQKGKGKKEKQGEASKPQQAPKEKAAPKKPVPEANQAQKKKPAAVEKPQPNSKNQQQETKQQQQNTKQKKTNGPQQQVQGQNKKTAPQQQRKKGKNGKKVVALANNSQPQKKGVKTGKSKPQVDKKQKKKKKQEKLESLEPIPVDEEQFKKAVNLENVKKIAKALKTLVEKEVSEKKNASIFSDYRYFLNVSSYKIPNCPKRMVKLNLQHSLVKPGDDDVVIIVPDLQRGAKVDYEPTIQHYEDLFREAGVENLKIVPFNQLRKECTNFEAKRKFANTYDYFLCDGRIQGHVVGFCGNPFQKPRTTFHAVRLNDPKKIKQEVERSLKRTGYRQLTKGDLISIPVGNHHYGVNELAENIMCVVEQLKTIYPGGWGNIRHMNLKIDIKGTSSMPIYANLAGPPAETPNVIGMREQRMLKLKKEANEVLEQFNLSKTGEFVKLDKEQVQRKRQIKEARKAVLVNEDDDDEEEEEEDESEEVPAKKAKKDKSAKPVTKEKEEEEDDDDSEDEEENEVDGDEDDDEEVEDDDEEVDDDDEEDDDDDEEEEDDDEEVDDDDEEDDDDDEEEEDDDDEAEDDEDEDDDDDE